MNREYDKFAEAMGYITAEEFYKIYDKFAKYLPDNIDYNNYDEEWVSLDEFFLELCVRKLTNNEDIYVYNWDDSIYTVEGCDSIEEVNQIQELLDELGFVWKEANKKSEIEFINDNI